MNWTGMPKGNTIFEQLKSLQKGTPMKHQYDLFEKFPDGSSLWRACVIGLQATLSQKSDLAQRSQNHFYALHINSVKLISLKLKHGAFNASQIICIHNRIA